MTAFKLALEIEQGATFKKTITWKAGTPPAPVDITGCTAHMQVRARTDCTTVVLDLSTKNGGIVLGGLTGTVALVISATQTAALVVHAGVYDLGIKFPDGTIRRLLSGAVTVSPRVTRA